MNNMSPGNGNLEGSMDEWMTKRTVKGRLLKQTFQVSCLFYCESFSSRKTDSLPFNSPFTTTSLVLPGFLVFIVRFSISCVFSHFHNHLSPWHITRNQTIMYIRPWTQ
jgi:hypothetical protein